MSNTTNSNKEQHYHNPQSGLMKLRYTALMISLATDFLLDDLDHEDFEENPHIFKLHIKTKLQYIQCRCADLDGPVRTMFSQYGLETADVLGQLSNEVVTPPCYNLPTPPPCPYSAVAPLKLPTYNPIFSSVFIAAKNKKRKELLDSISDDDDEEESQTEIATVQEASSVLNTSSSSSSSSDTNPASTDSPTNKTSIPLLPIETMKRMSASEVLEYYFKVCDDYRNKRSDVSGRSLIDTYQANKVIEMGPTTFRKTINQYKDWKATGKNPKEFEWTGFKRGYNRFIPFDKTPEALVPEANQECLSRKRVKEQLTGIKKKRAIDAGKAAFLVEDVDDSTVKRYQTEAVSSNVGKVANKVRHKDELRYIGERSPRSTICYANPEVLSNNNNGDDNNMSTNITPFWRSSCNGIIPIMQLIDIPYKNSNKDRNIQLREAIKTNHLHFLPTDKMKTRCIGNSEVLSFFSLSCEGDCKFYSDLKKPGQYGFRCNNCETLRASWEKTYVRKLRIRLINQSKTWQSCFSIADLPSAQKTIKSVLKIPSARLNDQGKSIRLLLCGLQKVMKSFTDKKVIHQDSFVRDFVAFWDENPKFRESLVVQLLEINIKRLSGHRNCPIPTRLLDFFCLLYSYDRKTASIFSSNFCGPNLRTIVRKAKHDSSIASCENFLMRDTRSIKRIITEHIIRLFPAKPSAGNIRVAFSVAIDATKVAKLLQICLKHNAVLGGAYPHHFINTIVSDDENDDQGSIVEKLKQILQDTSIVKADEVKVAVLTFQNSGNQSPYLILAGKAQTTNEASEFNNDIYRACAEAAKELTDKRSGYLVNFISASNDAVMSDWSTVVGTLVNTLRGKNDFFAMTDIPHNVKNCRYQILGLNSAVTIGKYILDIGLFPEAEVETEVYRVKDWASDKVVLRACSLKTCKKIQNVSVKDERTRTTLLVSLLFQRFHIASVQVKEILSYKTRIRMMWSSMIFVLHMDGIHSTTKRNWILGTIGTVFLLMMDDVYDIYLTTTECCEHTFGHARSMIKEFTVRDLCYIISKIARRMELIYRNDYSLHREASKGYNLEGGINGGDSCGNRTAGPLNVFDMKKDESIANYIWEHLRPIINEINNEMDLFLSKCFGVTTKHVLMKQFREYEANSPADLLHDVLTCMNKVEKFHFQADNQDDDGEYIPIDNDTVRPDNTDGADTFIYDDDEDVSVSDSVEVGLLTCETLTERYVEKLIEENKQITVSRGCGLNDTVTGIQSDVVLHENLAKTTQQVSTSKSTTKKKELLEFVDEAFSSLLSCSSLDDIEQATMKTNDDRSIISGLFEALHMKNRDDGIVSNEQRHQGLNSRYAAPKNETDNNDHSTSGASSMKFIQRGSVVEIKFGESLSKRFVVLALSDKYYGKWFMNSKGSRIKWPLEKKVLSTRLLAREVVLDNQHGIYRYKSYDQIKDHRDYHFRKDKPYILVENISSEVKDVLNGTMEL